MLPFYSRTLYTLWFVQWTGETRVSQLLSTWDPYWVNWSLSSVVSGLLKPTYACVMWRPKGRGSVLRCNPYFEEAMIWTVYPAIETWFSSSFGHFHRSLFKMTQLHLTWLRIVSKVLEFQLGQERNTCEVFKHTVVLNPTFKCIVLPEVEVGRDTCRP